MNLIDVAKMYWPKAYEREDGRIRLTKGSGYHKHKTIYNEIIRKKIDLKLEEFVLKGATDIVQSNTTKSVYFTFENIAYRISDHIKDFEGHQIIITI